MPAQQAEALLSSAHPGRNLPLSWTATLLLFALTIVFETCGTACMKMSNRSHWWQLGTVGFYVLSFGVFPLVLRRIPLSLAYAVWSGVGTGPVLLLSLFPIVNQMNNHFAHVTCVTHCSNSLYLSTSSLVVLISVLFFGETLSLAQVGCIILIIGGVVGLNVC